MAPGNGNAAPQSTEARELDLVGKVEFRIALASSDAKLQDLLEKYLAPLLLKLGSEHVNVRNKVISICQHINTRIEPQSVLLPVSNLLRQYKTTSVPLIRHFDILYIRRGLPRLSLTDRLALLPDLVSVLAPTLSTSRADAAQFFNSFLRLLPHAQLPARGAGEDAATLRAKLGLESDENAGMLAFWLGRLLLLSPVRPQNAGRASATMQTTCPGLTPAEYAFLTLDNNPSTFDPTTAQGLSLPETKAAALRLLSTSAFTDAQRLMPALFAAGDANARIADAGDDALERVLASGNVDLEDEALVRDLFALYLGEGDRPPVRPALRIELLGVLAKSAASATQARATRLADLVAGAAAGPQPPPQGTRETAKLRGAVFEYVHFFATSAPPEVLRRCGARLIAMLVAYIEGQGWPKMRAAEDITLRMYAYEVIGLEDHIGPRRVMLELLDFLFASLHEDTMWSADTPFSIEKALSSLLAPFSRLPASTSPPLLYDPDAATTTKPFSLQILLLRYAEPPAHLVAHDAIRARLGANFHEPHRSTRFAAVKFANRCLAYGDLVARWIDVLAAGGVADGGLRPGAQPPPEVVEEGLKGLDAHWFRMTNMDVGVGPQSEAERERRRKREELPDWGQLVDFFFRGALEPVVGADDLPAGHLPPAETIARFARAAGPAFAPAVAFARAILLARLLQTSPDTAVPVDADWRRRLDVAVATDPRARAVARRCVRDRADLVPQPPLELLLHALFGALVANSGVGLAGGSGEGGAGGAGPRLGADFVELVALTPEERLRPVVVALDLGAAVGAATANAEAQRETGARAFGLLATFPAKKGDPGVRALVRDLVRRMRGWEVAVGAEVNGVAGATLTLGFYFAKLKYRGRERGEVEGLWEEFFDCLVAMLKGMSDHTLIDAAFATLDQLSLFGVMEAAELVEKIPLKELVEAIMSKAKSGNERAILTLGHLAMIFPESQEEGKEAAPEKDGEGEDTATSAPLRYILNQLHSLHTIRTPETHFALGEALSCLSASWASSVLHTHADIADLDRPRGQPRSRTLPALLDRVIADCTQTKPSLKKAAVIWLLCLVQYSDAEAAAASDAVRARLRPAQRAFKACLTNRDELVQEAASRGLGLVYERGDAELKRELVRDLVGSFTGETARGVEADGSAAMAGAVTPETELFEPGALPTGDGQSVSTYRDVLSLAAEVGDSSLVYRFMALAANNAIWSSRAAFGRFGLGSVFAGVEGAESYLRENPKVVAKLYRWRFDPNPNVKRSMNDIWTALIKEPNKAIDTHFDAIMTDLLGNILGKEWRVRQACCDAIGDLIRGRKLETYEKYLTKIWTKAFKVLDDIKDSVRQAANGLAQALTSVLIRSLEAGESSAKNSEAMLTHILPFLLSPAGLHSSADDVRDYALTTLVKIIRNGSPHSLRRFIPELMEHLLMQLTALEPQAINYLHLNAEKYQVTVQEIDDARLKSVRLSPLSDAIDRCIDMLDEPTMTALVPVLERTVKAAVGLPSKVGCSRALVSLSTRRMLLFKPHADQFLRLAEREIMDRNDTVASSYAAALGYLARTASDAQILATADFARSLYLNADDDRSRAAAGDVFAAVSKLAPDRFNRLTSALLPFCFVAKNDSAPTIREPFAAAWADNVGGARVVLLYLREILDVATPLLDANRWALRRAAARAIAEAARTACDVSAGATVDGQKVGVGAKEAELLWPALVAAVAGKTWEGKEVVLEAFAKFVEKADAFWKERRDVGVEINKIALREAKRQNVAYRVHAVKALGKVAAARTDMDMFDEVAKVVEPLVEELAGDAEDAMDVDEEGGTVKKGSLREDTLASAVEALQDAITTKTIESKDVLSTLSKTLALFRTATAPDPPSRAVLPAAFRALKLLLAKLRGREPWQNNAEERAFFETLDPLLFGERTRGAFDTFGETARTVRAEALVVVCGLGWDVCGKDVRERIEEEIGREKSEVVRVVLRKG
ncbi:proteasome stabiliser-domain-containing protein [Lineolata rhizophorae]|uniref:Proteasome stabiliser-domain-containing protein n=1 Tax=Lineolata rhizophorae TaxID=578093 RepID=A0A6A6NT48_9PEZI|nr:proteasome stabiliser-domain-containing protein [Lineolata rhizophorae]